MPLIPRRPRAIEPSVVVCLDIGFTFVVAVAARCVGVGHKRTRKREKRRSLRLDMSLLRREAVYLRAVCTGCGTLFFHGENEPRAPKYTFLAILNTIISLI